MTKFLHVGDLHIGKNSYGKSRTDDAEFALNQIIDFSRIEKPDFIILSGDVFDEYNPEMEDLKLLFSDFVLQIRALDIPLVIVRGNHDNPKFLNTFKVLAEFSKIYIFSEISNDINDYCISINDVNIIAIPYISPRAINRLSEDSNIKYATKLEAFIGHIISKAPRNNFNILLTHIMVNGAKIANSEKVASVSEFYAINLNNIQNIHTLDYIALGHVHRYQQINAPTIAYYPGSCYQIDFGEEDQEKFFNYVILESNKTPSVEKIKLKIKNELKTFKVNASNINQISEQINHLNGYAKVIIEDAIENSKILERSLRLKEISNKILEISKQSFQNLQSNISLDTMKEQKLIDFYKDYYEITHNGTKLPLSIEQAFIDLENEVDQDATV